MNLWAIYKYYNWELIILGNERDYKRDVFDYFSSDLNGYRERLEDGSKMLFCVDQEGFTKEHLQEHIDRIQVDPCLYFFHETFFFVASQNTNCGRIME